MSTNTQDANSQAGNDKTQDLVSQNSPYTQLLAIREKVARVLCWKNGMNPDLTLGGDGQNFLWHEYESEASAAIITTFEELSRIELPQEATIAADNAEVFYENGHVGVYGPEFRAVCATLLDIFKKEVA